MEASLKHVLFVENNQHFMRKQLEQAELKCSVAENRLMAQQILANSRIDLVITDYHMSIMGESASIQWMQRTQFTIPVIVLSGEMPEEIRTHIEPTNIVAILSKPCSFSDLYLKILEVFNTSKWPFSDGSAFVRIETGRFNQALE